jgi:hypothetical protein
MLKDGYQQPAKGEEKKMSGDTEMKADQRQFKSYRLEKSQKIAAAVLAFFAFLIIVIWSVQFKKSITQPFAYQLHQQSATNQQPANVCPNGQCNQSEKDLKNKDTDGDGLSDWDELNIYNTSPYLEDSDSDGFSDKQEINNGKDPNCPAGQNCYNQTVKNSALIKENKNENNLAADSFEQLNTAKQNALNKDSVTNSTLNVDDLKAIKDLDAVTLRQILREAGMSQELLNQISDEDLINTWREVIDKEKE